MMDSYYSLEILKFFLARTVLMKKDTFLNLFPVVNFLIFSLAIVEGENVHFLFVSWIFSGENFSDDETISKIHLGIANWVGKIKPI